MISKAQATDIFLKAGYTISVDYKDNLYFEKTSHPMIALGDNTFTIFNYIIPEFAISPATSKSCYACEYYLKDCEMTTDGMLSLPDPCHCYWC